MVTVVVVTGKQQHLDEMVVGGDVDERSERFKGGGAPGDVEGSGEEEVCGGGEAYCLPRESPHRERVVWGSDKHSVDENIQYWYTMNEHA